MDLTSAFNTILPQIMLRKLKECKYLLDQMVLWILHHETAKAEGQFNSLWNTGDKYRGPTRLRKLSFFIYIIYK